MTVAVDGWKNRRQKRDRIRCGVHHIALVTSGALVIYKINTSDYKYCYHTICRIDVRAKINSICEYNTKPNAKCSN